VVTTAIEHPAVLEACAQVTREGGTVTRVPVGRSGVVDPLEIRRALRPETVLVSVMHANNELGTVQPVAEIAAIAREAGVLSHSDGVQAAGRLPVNVKELGVDLYSLSGHKLNAPKGVGTLYVKKGTPLGSILHGGRHERERRPGTENVPGAAALGAACEWLWTHRAAEADRVARLRDRLETGILARVPKAYINGDPARRTPNTTNIRFDYIEGEAIVISLDLAGFAVSSGSACSSGSIEPSHVLLALGLPPDEARSAVRFSLGRGNDERQVDLLIQAVAESVAHLRRVSPQTPAAFERTGKK
jgi:cysteine desulfurase